MTPTQRARLKQALEGALIGAIDEGDRQKERAARDALERLRQETLARCRPKPVEAKEPEQEDEP